MRILVYGAGVLGSLYAARLAEAGQDVTILARGQRLADIRQHGIVLEEAASGRRTATAVTATDELAPDDAYDLVLVFVRKSQLSSVLPALAANRNTPNVAFLMNNAAGPDDIVAALGRGRVLLGFPAAGGTRDGHVVRYTAGGDRPRPITLGELDGGRSDRLDLIAAVFADAGIGVRFSENIDAWLKTHVALVSPVANAIYSANGDIYRLARTRDGLLLMVRAVSEGMAVLRALGLPILPRSLSAVLRLPEPLLLPVLARFFATPQAELAMARHANAARDEMKLLADEFKALARRAGAQTPYRDRLYAFLDPATEPLPEGSAEIPLDWRGVRTGAGIAAAAAVAGLAVSRLRHS